MSDVGDDGMDQFRPGPPPPRKRFSERDSLVHSPNHSPNRSSSRSSSRSRVSDVNAGLDRPSGAWPSWLPWVAVVLLVAVAVVPRLHRASSDPRISYSELLTLAGSSGVVSAHVDNTSGHIAAALTDGRRVSSTGRIPLPEADARTLASNATLDYRTSTSPWWHAAAGPALLAALLLSGWLLVGRRRHTPFDAMSTIGQSRARVWTTERPGTTFADVAGYAGTKAEITEVVAFLTDPQQFRAMGARIPKGILLVGPPGTGKTLMARAVAGEAGVAFFTVTGSDFMELFVGVGAARVRDLFRQARQQAPCIVFIDEIDSIGRKRGAGMGGGHDEREQTLNQLLAEMDGFEGTDGVVVIAATNRPDILDQALLRPGRFDRQVMVPLPELNERHAILRVHTANKPLAADVDLLAIARYTPGMSGADLANLMNEAALGAVRHRTQWIMAADVEAARDRVLLGQHRESLILTAAERTATAFHEAGHAILAHVLEHADPLLKVSIMARSTSLGVTMQLADEDRHTATELELRDRLAVAMGGRVAELMVFDNITTGASDDLLRSTDLARRMVREWGMSDRIGPMAWGYRAQVFLGEDLMHAKDCSDATLHAIDLEVERILRHEERRAHDILGQHRRALDTVAHALLERETLSAADVAQLLTQPGTGAANERGATAPELVSIVVQLPAHDAERH